MNLFELITALLAPHLCLVCKKESAPLCLKCAKNCFEAPRFGCYRCQKQTANFASCHKCKSHSPIEYLWVCSLYSGAAKELVALLKFQRVKAAASVIAHCLDAALPALPNGIIIAPVPTTNKRIRMRGYDQAELIASKLAHKRGLPCQNLLRRVKNTRQVGSSRKRRFRQLQDAFASQQTAHGQQVLLVDDVLTTGATLEAAANALKQVGAKQINAAVFAYQPLKQRTPVVPEFVSNNTDYG